MSQNRLNGCVFFLILIVLMIGAVNATEVSDDVNETKTTTSVNEDITDTTPQTIDKNKEITTCVSSIDDITTDNEDKKIVKNHSQITKGDDVEYYGSVYRSNYATYLTPTEISINYIPTKNRGDVVTITGKFQDFEYNPLRLTTLTININGQKYNTVTNGKGIYSYNYTTVKGGLNTVTVSYGGNSLYEEAISTRQFTVYPIPTKISVKVQNGYYNDYCKIWGLFTDESDNALRYTTLTINVNGKNYYAKTDNDGYYEYDYKTSAIGRHNVTVSYGGNSKYAKTLNKNAFTVTAIPTIITINDIKTLDVGCTIKIKGNYTDLNNNALRYTSLLFNIDGNKMYVKTNCMGEFNFNYRTTKIGDNNLTISYPGNSKYAGNATEKKFYVTQNGKYLTQIELYTYHLNSFERYYNGFVDIPGRYFYNDNIPLKYTPLTMYVNGKKYTVKTNENGIFCLDYRTKTLGKTNITVSYPGNSRFLGATASGSFTTIPMPVDLTVDKISTKQYSDTVQIKGTLSYDYENYLKSTAVHVIINENDYITRTDNNGIFKYNFKATKIGTNKVTVTFKGYTGYETSSVETSFYVNKKDTFLYVKYIDDCNIGKTVTISGRYTDYDDNPLKSTPINIKINGKAYSAKTDSNGYYTLNYKTEKEGTNNVTVSYAGNARYKGDTDSVTFVVSSGIKTATFNVAYSDDWAIYTRDGDDFYCFYEDKEAQYYPGVYVELRNSEAEYLDDLAPVNKIISVKFYFKNSNGNIKTVTEYSYYPDSVSTSLISGYTPYKVDVTYRKRTAQETQDWYNQFQ